MGKQRLQGTWARDGRGWKAKAGRKGDLMHQPTCKGKYSVKAASLGAALGDLVLISLRKMGHGGVARK